jgi:predicted nucleic-acid-binding Zn-ribbon protein
MAEMDSDLLTGLEVALESLTENDIKEILATIDPVSWIENRRILKGKPFSFENRNYLLQPYRDESKNIIFMKGRQVEMSEFSMNWLLNKLDVHPYTTGIHAFPRTGQAEKFTKQRLNSAISDSEYIRNWNDARNSEQVMRKFVKKADARGLEPYNFYILGGTWESRKDTVGDAARGISLDFIVYDERQDHPDDVETVIGEGASHSEFKQTITLGTPKLPGIQFDQQWNVSDKNYWHVTCVHCGYTAPITMDNILDSGDEELGYYYGCPHCKTPLDRNNGVWMATNPQKRPEYRGYHINQLMVCWLDPNEIMTKKNSPTFSRRRFYNEVLGESYGGDDIPITIAMMEECGKNEYRLGQLGEKERIYCGVDWGAKSYLWIHNKNHRLIDLYIAEESDPREHPKTFAKHIAKYKQYVKKVVCDAGPDITRYYALRDELARLNVTSQVFACYYATPPAKTDVSWDDKKMIVTVGRSEAIECIIDEVSDTKLILPGYDLSNDKVDTAIEHFTNIAAEKTTNKSGNAFIMYVDTGPDHFLHAKLYADIASGGAEYLPIGKSAAPITNPRERTKSGIWLPSGGNRTFPKTNTGRNRIGNKSKRR